jgi:hypothetical protein
MTDKEGSLKEISDKLEEINDTLKKAFLKEPEKNEEREFQIKLAKLQADVQIQLTACFSFIVLMVTSALGAWQVISTPAANLPLPIASIKDVLFYIYSSVALVSAFGVLYSFWKMKSKRKEMDNL